MPDELTLLTEQIEHLVIRYKKLKLENKTLKSDNAVQLLKIEKTKVTLKNLIEKINIQISEQT